MDVDKKESQQASQSSQTSQSSQAAERYFPTLAIMSTAYIAVGVNAQGFKAMLPLVRDDFGIGRTEAGFYTTFFFLSATIIAIFSGRLVDRFGPKAGLVFGTGLMGVLMVLHSAAPFFSMVLFLSFLAGVGFSIITPSINKGVLEMVPYEKRSVSIGITQSGAGIGGVLGATLLPFLGETFGWRNAILVSAAIALLMSAAMAKFYNPKKLNQTKHSGENANASESQSSEKKNSFLADLRLLGENKALLTVIIMGFVFGFSIGNVTTHYVIFLNEDIGLSATLAGFNLAIFQFGGIVGKPSWGYINDQYLKSDRRTGLYILGVFVTAMMLFLGFVVARVYLPVFAILVVSFLLGLASLGLPGLFFTALGDVVSQKLMGTATGLALVFIRLGVVTGPPFIGAIADFTGQYQLSWIVLGIIVFLLSTGFYIKSASYLSQLAGRRV